MFNVYSAMNYRKVDGNLFFEVMLKRVGAMYEKLTQVVYVLEIDRRDIKYYYREWIEQTETTTR